MSLKDCIDKAGKLLKKKDAKALTDLVASGATEAEAVKTYLNSIDVELTTIAEMVERQGGTVVRVGKTTLPSEAVPVSPAQTYLKRATDAQADLEERVVTGFRAGKPLDKNFLKRERTKIARRIEAANKNIARAARADRKIGDPDAALDRALQRYEAANISGEEIIAVEEAMLTSGAKTSTVDLRAAEVKHELNLAKASASIERAKKRVSKRGAKELVEDPAIYDVGDVGDVGDIGDVGGGGDGTGPSDGAGGDRPAGFDMPTYSRQENFIRRWQDKFRPLLQVQRNIAEAKGITIRDLPEWVDVYSGEEVAASKSEQDLDRITAEYVKPLTKHLAETNLSREELDLYLVAKFAKDRNAQVSERTAGEFESGSGMTDEAAESVLALATDEGKIANLEVGAQYVYDMLQTHRDLMQENLINPDEVAIWESNSPFYVPLKGTDSNGEPIAGVSGKGVDVRGKETFKALGRRTMADSPISYAIKDSADTIIRHHQNEVGNRFFELVRENPHPDWQIFSRSNPDIDREGKPVINYTKGTYFATKKAGVQYYIRIKDKTLLKALTGMTPEAGNSLMRMSGWLVRKMSALNTSYNPEFILSNLPRDVQTAIFNVLAEQDIAEGRAKGGELAAEMVKGIPKSMAAIAASLSGRKLNSDWGIEHQTKFEMFLEDGAKTGWVDIQNIDGHIRSLDAMLLEAQGGVRGNTRKMMRTITEFVIGMNTAVENATRLSVYMAALDATNTDGSDKFTRAQAASIAKNLTVNFNRKGEYGQALSQMYMFANASIQGTAVFLRAMGTMKTNADGTKSFNAAQKVAGGVFASAIGIAALNRQFAGDDDDGRNWYDKIPNYERERNMIFMKSIFGVDAPGEYYKIPLPYGFNIFYVLGDQTEAMLQGDRSPGKAATHIAASFLASFSPLGMNESDELGTWAAKTFTPTIVQPLIQHSVNENFFGTKIYRENFPSGREHPDSQLGKRRTSEHWKNVAQFVNSFTGGTNYIPGAIDINPDSISHLVNNYLGGAGQFVARTYAAVEKLATGDDLQAREVPFRRRVEGKVLPYDDIKLFTKRRKLIEQVTAEHKRMKVGIPKQRYGNKYVVELGLSGLAKTTQKKIKRIQKERNNVEDNIELSNKLKTNKLDLLDIRHKAAIDKFNKRWVDLKNK